MEILSVIFAYFNFLGLTPSSLLLFIYPILHFLHTAWFSLCVSLSGCDSVNIHCRECNQTDVSLWRPINSRETKVVLLNYTSHCDEKHTFHAYVNMHSSHRSTHTVCT